MNLWLQVIAISVALTNVRADGSDCPKVLDGIASCVIKLKKDKDLQALVDQKVASLKDCEASETNLKCFKASHDCISKVEEKVGDSSERKDALKAAAACWDKEPKNPLSGIAELFQDMSEFLGFLPPPPPPPGWRPPPPGKGDPPPPPPPGGPPPDLFPLPDECDPGKVDPKVVNCSFTKMTDGKDALKLISTLGDKLKDCKKDLVPGCVPRGPSLLGCLLQAYKPAVKLAAITYKECMDKAGYNVPPPPNLDGGGSSSNSSMFF